MKARDIMTVPIIEILESASVRRAAEIMAAQRAGILVVTDEDGRMRAVVTDRDLLLRSVAAGFDPNTLTVGECTAGPGSRLIAVKPDDDLEHVIEAMRGAGTHRVLVSEDGVGAIGLISLDEVAVDVKRYLDEFLSVASRYHRM